MNKFEHILECQGQGPVSWEPVWSEDGILCRNSLPLEQTYRNENNTFPQLRWWVVTIASQVNHTRRFLNSLKYLMILFFSELIDFTHEMHWSVCDVAFLLWDSQEKD